MSMGTRGSYTPAEQRNDQVEGDVANAIKAANNGDTSNDESADVKDADGVHAGVPSMGLSLNMGNVAAPKAAPATSKNVVVQHGPGASRVKP
jgi:hypothetical protein